MSAEHLIAKNVALCIVRQVVDSPINLHGEAECCAVEIEDEPTERVLAPELQAEATTVSENVPDEALRPGRCPT